MNFESTGEPFPVKPTVRSKAHRDLIMRDAEVAGVLEEAQVPYEVVPPWVPEY
jgi:hypothetical protein